MKPYQVLIFTAVVMGILGALYWAFPGESAEESEYAEYSEYSEVSEVADTIAADTIVPEEPVVEEKPVVVVPKVAVDSTTDSRVFLEKFYAALEEAGTKKVRVTRTQAIAATTIIAPGKADDKTLGKNLPVTRSELGSNARIKDGIPMVTMPMRVSCFGSNGKPVGMARKMRAKRKL